MRLPIEILEHILQCTLEVDHSPISSSLGAERRRLRHLSTFRLVDQDWNGVATPLLFRSLCLGTDAERALRLLRTLTESPALAGMVKTLEISSGIQGHRHDDLVVLLLKFCPNLEELWIRDFEVSLSALLTAAPQLRYVQLDSCVLIGAIKSSVSVQQQHSSLDILVLKDTDGEISESPHPPIRITFVCLSPAYNLDPAVLADSLAHAKYLDWDGLVAMDDGDDLGDNSKLNKCSAITHLQAPVLSCLKSRWPDDDLDYVLFHLRNSRIETFHLLELATVDELVLILDQDDLALSNLSTFLYRPSTRVKDKESLKAEVEVECTRRKIKFGGICSGGLEEFGKMVFPKCKLMLDL